MMLLPNDLQHLKNIAIAAAREAGELIASHAGRIKDVYNKENASSLASQVFTEVDLLSQELILEKILPTCKEYDLALLAEESEDDKSRFEKDYFWCIDPLDGTLPFVEGRKSGFSVAIALVSKLGEPQIGIIYEPISKNIYSAVKGFGAFRNDEPWRVSDNEVDDFTFVCDSSFTKHKNFDAVLSIIEKEFCNDNSPRVKMIQHGGAVMNACWVLENAPACYFKFPKQVKGGGGLWDFAASACVVKEAGGFVGDIHGEVLDLNRRACTFMNHKGVLFATNKEMAQAIVQLVRGFVN